MGGTLRRPEIAATQDLPSPPRQARSVEKRARLLDAGRALFREKGYEATSIADVTARAGMAAGAFYLYFRSKRQLLIVLMNELTERLAAVDLTPAMNLRAFIAALFRTDLENLGVIRAWHEAIAADPELRAMHAEIEAWTHARILNLFRALNPRRGADLHAFASMMDRHFWSLLSRASTLTPRELQREARIAADVIERYLFDAAKK